MNLKASPFGINTEFGILTLTGFNHFLLLFSTDFAPFFWNEELQRPAGHIGSAAMDKHFNTILLFWLKISTNEQRRTLESNSQTFPQHRSLKRWLVNDLYSKNEVVLKLVRRTGGNKRR